MTRDVVTVPDDMAVASVARVLAEAGISAVPVTDQASRLLGIVAELDLLRRLAGAGEAPSGWLASLFVDQRALAERYTRTHGLKARDVMTRHVATITEDARAEAIARLIEDKGIRSVPVVTADGTLCGIVSRSDLLRAVLAPASSNPKAAADQRIRRGSPEAMRRQPWAAVHSLSVDVEDGVWSRCRAITARRRRSRRCACWPRMSKACGGLTTRRGQTACATLGTAAAAGVDALCCMPLRPGAWVTHAVLDGG